MIYKLNKCKCSQKSSFAEKIRYSLVRKRTFVRMMKRSKKISLFAPEGKISKEFLYALCSSGDQGMYVTPHLNDILYLHQKGIRQIGNLEDYTNVKCLYLQNNVIGKIENINHFKSLTLLFLNDNCIEKIENLEGLDVLDKIDLSRNNIKVIENLSCLKSLTSLDVSHNKLMHIDDIAHLGECPNITLLRLSHNKLADPDTLQALSKLEKLKALFLDGNPLINVISPYRKKVILAFPELCYLDDRPINAEERRLTEAWGHGGKNAEDLLKLEMKLQKEQEMKELHLKTFERMKQRYPELYNRESLVDKEANDITEEDLGQTEFDDICPIKMPWHNRPTVLNDHARRLVEEIETEPFIPESEHNVPELEEVAEILEDVQLEKSCDKEESCVQIEAEEDEKPACILEYIKQLEKEKMEKKLTSDTSKSAFPAENGLKCLPEELHFPLNQRIQIWEDLVSGNCNDEEVDTDEDSDASADKDAESSEDYLT